MRLSDLYYDNPALAEKADAWHAEDCTVDAGGACILDIDTKSAWIAGCLSGSAAQRSDVHWPPLSLPDAASSTSGGESFVPTGSTSREVGSDESSRTYCLVMDSGAAWHVTGAKVERCPNDGCDCGEADRGGWLPA